MKLPYPTIEHLIFVSAALLLAGCQSPEQQTPQRSAETAQQLLGDSEPFKGRSVESLMSDSAAMQVADRLFGAQCASCHGADGRGSRRVIDLTAGRFNYGSTEAAVRTTIVQGRKSVMPPMGQANLGAVDLGQLVAYVRSLSSEDGDSASTYEQRGKLLFDQHCAVCHGPDGHGSVEKGAPNLADDYWQNGDSMMNIRLAITGGAKSECPAHPALSAPEVDLLTARVLKLAGRPSDAG